MFICHCHNPTHPTFLYRNSISNKSTISEKPLMEHGLLSLPQHLNLCFFVGFMLRNRLFYVKGFVDHYMSVCLLLGHCIAWFSSNYAFFFPLTIISSVISLLNM